MKMAKNWENDKFLHMPLKHVSGLTGLVNSLVTLKQWAIAHENVQKLRKRPVFGHNSQTCIGYYGPLNRPVTLKLWAIAYENCQKLRNRLVFRHASQTCIGSYGPCKSPRNPITVGNIS